MPFIRSESCSFIWHPNVVTWKRLAGARIADRRVPSRASPAPRASTASQAVASGDEEAPAVEGLGLEFGDAVAERPVSVGRAVLVKEVGLVDEDVDAIRPLLALGVVRRTLPGRASLVI